MLNSSRASSVIAGLVVDSCTSFSDKQEIFKSRQIVERSGGFFVG
jgi:hypothetical protein